MHGIYWMQGRYVMFFFNSELLFAFAGYVMRSLRVVKSKLVDIKTSDTGEFGAPC